MDAMREAFEKHMSDDGAWPRAVERYPDGGYRLMTAVSGWQVWQAAWAASAENAGTLKTLFPKRAPDDLGRAADVVRVI